MPSEIKKEKERKSLIVEVLDKGVFELSEAWAMNEIVQGNISGRGYCGCDGRCGASCVSRCGCALEVTVKE